MLLRRVVLSSTHMNPAAKTLAPSSRAITLDASNSHDPSRTAPPLGLKADRTPKGKPGSGSGSIIRKMVINCSLRNEPRLSAWCMTKLWNHLERTAPPLRLKADRTPKGKQGSGSGSIILVRGDTTTKAHHSAGRLQENTSVLLQCTQPRLRSKWVG